MTNQADPAFNPAALPAELHARAGYFAELEGVPLEQWIVEAVAAKVETAEFFHRRARGSSSRPLCELLDKAPARTPDPGDEFEP